MTKIVWKKNIFFAVYTSTDDSNFWRKKMLIWLKNISSVKKIPVSNGESFLESIFDLNQILQNTAFTKPLNLEIDRNWLASYFL